MLVWFWLSFPQIGNWCLGVLPTYRAEELMIESSPAAALDFSPGWRIDYLIQKLGTKRYILYEFKFLAISNSVEISEMRYSDCSNRTKNPHSFKKVFTHFYFPGERKENYQQPGWAVSLTHIFLSCWPRWRPPTGQSWHNSQHESNSSCLVPSQWRLA